MGNHRAKWGILVVLAVLLLVLSSCVQWEDPPEVTTCFLSMDGSPVTLRCPYTSPDDCIWYSCTDASGSGAVAVSVGSEFLTPSFSEPGMRHFYCVFTSGGVEQTSPVFTVAFTGLATVSIDTDDGQEIRSKTQYVGATIRIDADSSVMSESAFRKVKALEPTHVLIKGRGASSWVFMPNKSYNLKFDAGKVSILDGVKKSKRWCLTANYIDNSEMGNWYASYVGNKVFSTVWEPSFEYVNVVVNGDFRGLYLIGETVKIDSNRVDVPDVSEVSTLADDLNGDGKIDLDDAGYILEICSETNNSSFTTLHGINVTFKDPDLEELDKELCSYSRTQIINAARMKVNRLEAAIMGDSQEDFTTLMDLSSMVDWLLANLIVCNNESNFVTSCYFYYDPEEGKFFMGPNWDFDRSLTNREPGSVLTLGNMNHWYNALVENEVFVEALKARWNEKLSSAIAESISAVGQTESRISTALAFDALRWSKEIVMPGSVSDWLTRHVQLLTDFIEGL